MKTEIILPNSESNGAQYKDNIEGWVSSSGRYWGNDERMARWEGATHVECSECKAPATKSYTKCNACRDKAQEDTFNDLAEYPFKSWPVAMYIGDEYFFDADQLFDYCYDNETTPDKLSLCHCYENRLQQIDTDYWEDALPEDCYDLPADVQTALDSLNEAIRSSDPVSFGVDGKRLSNPNDLIDIAALNK